MREARCSFGWLAPWLALFAVMLARAQPINIDLSASGSGTVETPHRPKAAVVEGGLIQLTGSGFTTDEIKILIGSIPLRVAAESASRKQSGAKIPIGTTSGVLSFTQEGCLLAR